MKRAVVFLFVFLATSILTAAAQTPPAPAKATPKPTPVVPVKKTAGNSVTLTTADEWIISGVYKAAQDDKPTLVLLHDLGKDRNSFASFADKLAEHGYGYLAIDLRGHGESQNKGGAYSFAREGVDNEYNKSVRDVDIAVTYLKNRRIDEKKIILLGAGLGANIASKSTGFWPQIGGLALLTPTANNRDVLAIPPMRLYKGNIFIGAAADDKKTFLEASIIRNVAFLSAGEGKVTFATAYQHSGHELLDVYLTPFLLQWLQTPEKPEVKPDLVLPEEGEVDLSAFGEESMIEVEPTGTEEALFPSVLF